MATGVLATAVEFMSAERSVRGDEGCSMIAKSGVSVNFGAAKSEQSLKKWANSEMPAWPGGGPSRKDRLR